MRKLTEAQRNLLDFQHRVTFADLEGKIHSVNAMDMWLHSGTDFYIAYTYDGAVKVSVGEGERVIKELLKYGRYLVEYNNPNTEGEESYFVFGPHTYEVCKQWLDARKIENYLASSNMRPTQKNMFTSSDVYSVWVLSFSFFCERKVAIYYEGNIYENTSDDD